MPSPFAHIAWLFAQAAPAAGQDTGTGMSTTFLMLMPVLVLFYFMIMRPQQQQERKRKQMVDALKRNDRVLTAAGIYGTVVSVDTDADRVVLRVDDDKGVKIPFSKASIVRVLEAAEKEKAAEPAQRS